MPNKFLFLLIAQSDAFLDLNWEVVGSLQLLGNKSHRGANVPAAWRYLDLFDFTNCEYICETLNLWDNQSSCLIGTSSNINTESCVTLPVLSIAISLWNTTLVLHHFFLSQSATYCLSSLPHLPQYVHLLCWTDCFETVNEGTNLDMDASGFKLGVCIVGGAGGCREG